VTSSSGNINFNIDNDANGTHEARLTVSGLAIGSNLDPSANLHVSGNSIISRTLGVGGSNFGSSNLTISGTFGQSLTTISSNAILGNCSLVLADSSSSNLF